MVKRMLIDATHLEETRVVIANGTRLDEFDFESSTKKQLKGNIYLAKVTRVEPSLQAAFVDFGGNRHGFLPFSEIHPDYYQIPAADRAALLEEQRRSGGFGGGDDADFGPEPDDEPITREAEQPDHDHGFAEDHGHDHAHEHDGQEHSHDHAHAAERDGAHENHAHDDHAHDGHAQEPSEQPSAYAVETAQPAATDAPLAEDLPPAPAPEAAPASDDSATQAEDRPASMALDNPPGEGDVVASAEIADGQLLNGDASEDDQHGDHQDGDDIAEADIAEVGDGAPKPVEVVGGADEVEAEVESAAAERRRGRSRSRHHYKIQDVIKRRQILLVQVVKEERGNKGAALTTYLSLAGRYCVLMPNTARGGGISRKISNPADRKRLKAHLDELEIPEGMAVILRTAAVERSKAELRRDYDYLVRQWDEVRELTLKSIAPAPVYEEASLIKRSIRDHYSKDIDEVLVEGDEGYRVSKEFMRMLMPSHARKVQQYRDPEIPLFHRYQIETQLDAMHNPVVTLKSGGYIVINPTEALVSIDVNSGRATRERNIEETAYKTNLEAAEEIARQLRLRDLAGLIVIDFIDMEESRNQHTVEKRLKEAMRIDRARIQIGKISAFGLLELSRQRLRPSFLEASTEICKHCAGTGVIRSTESAALHVIRGLEEEGIRRRASEVKLSVPTAVAIYLMNHKRSVIASLEARYDFRIFVGTDDSLIPPDFKIDRLKAQTNPPPVRTVEPVVPDPEDDLIDEEIEEEDAEAAPETRETGREAGEDAEERGEDGGERRGKRRRRRRRRGDEREDRPARAPRGDEGAEGEQAAFAGEESGDPASNAGDAGESDGSDDVSNDNGGDNGENGDRKRRRRGKRGGRRRRRDGAPNDAPNGERAPREENGGDDLAAGSETDSRSDAQPAWRSAETAAEPPAADPVAQIAPMAYAAPAPQPEPVAAVPAATPEPAEDPNAPKRKGWWQRLTE
ncbi:MAG: Rne/Rng family ribonuclease [Alphaproteobacteria bacterium]